MPRAIRKCRYCGIEITMTNNGGMWRSTADSTYTCPGQANGHRPSNALRKRTGNQGQ